MGFGYRLFYFSLTERFGRTELDLGDAIDGQTPPKWLKKRLKALCSSDDVRGMPSLKNTADGDDVTPSVPAAKGDLAIRWESRSQPSDRHLSALVRYGRIDGHDLAIGGSGDANIVGKAPSHLFRVDFFFPKGGGPQGLLVVEDIDRSSPAQMVAQWVGKQSKWDAKPSDGQWWRMTLQRLSDEGRLAELIKNSKSAEIRLERFAKTGGGKRRVTPLRVTAPVEQAKDRKLIAGEVAKWVAGDRNAMANSVSILADVAGEGVSDLDLDRAGVYLNDAHTTKRLDPDHLDDVFVYPIGDSKPTAEAWKTAILTRLSALSGTMPFDVEW